MDNDRKIFVCFISFILIAILLGTCSVIKYVGKESPNVYDFAVDSTGRVYVYIDEHISVYLDGHYLYEYSNLNDMQSVYLRGARFAITENDELWMIVGNSFYAMDLAGNLIEKSSYSQAFQKSSYIGNRNRIYKDMYGNVYEMKGQFFGWTRVVKNSTEIVFQISGLAFFAKFGTMIGFLCLIPVIVVACRSYWREHCFFDN